MTEQIRILEQHDDLIVLERTLPDGSKRVEDWRTIWAPDHKSHTHTVSITSQADAHTHTQNLALKKCATEGATNHSHTTTSDAGAHTHSLSGTTGASDLGSPDPLNHTHTISLTSGSESTHVHASKASVTNGCSGVSGCNTNKHSHTLSVTSAPSAAHTHAVSGSTGTGTGTALAHTHSISITSGAPSASHNHTHSTSGSEYCYGGDEHNHTASAMSSESTHTHLFSGNTASGGEAGSTTYTKEFTCDAILQKTDQPKTFTADIILQKTSLTNAFTADGSLSKQGVTLPFTVDARAEEYPVSTVSLNDATGLPFQRHSFFAKGHHYIFFAKLEGTHLHVYFVKGHDGLTWDSAVKVSDDILLDNQANPSSGGVFFALAFEQQDKIHLVASCYGTAVNRELKYLRGAIDDSGEVSWGAVQTVYAEAAGYLFYDLDCCVDENGYLWVGFRRTSGTYNHPFILRNSHNDGTWLTDPNVGVHQLSTTSTAGWGVHVCTYGTTGQAYIVWSRGSSETKGKLWNGSAWGNEESPLGEAAYSARAICLAGDGCRLYVDLIYMQSLISGTYHLHFRRRHLNGGWETEENVKTSGLSDPNCRPGICVLKYTGDLLIFWMHADHVYYRWRSSDGAWQAETDWIDESGSQGLAVIGYHSANWNAKTHVVAFCYMRKEPNSQFGVRYKPLDFRIAKGHTMGSSTMDPFQRKTFYARDLMWTFYATVSPARIEYRTSSNGLSFSSPIVVLTELSTIGRYLSLWYDETHDYVHFVYYSPSTLQLQYRRARPNSDGTLSWSTDAWKLVHQFDVGDTPQNMTVGVDTSERAWIGWSNNTYGHRDVWVNRNNNTDGDWRDYEGFPLKFVDVYPHACWLLSPVPLSNGDVYIIYVHDQTTCEYSLTQNASVGDTHIHVSPADSLSLSPEQYLKVADTLNSEYRTVSTIDTANGIVYLTAPLGYQYLISRTAQAVCEPFLFGRLWSGLTETFGSREVISTHLVKSEKFTCINPYNDIIHVVFNERTDKHIIYYQRNSSGVWQPGEHVYSSPVGEQCGPVCYQDHQGNIVAFWIDTDGKIKQSTRSYITQTWAPAVVFKDESGEIPAGSSLDESLTIPQYGSVGSMGFDLPLLYQVYTGIVYDNYIVMGIIRQSIRRSVFTSDALLKSLGQVKWWITDLYLSLPKTRLLDVDASLKKLGLPQTFQADAVIGKRFAKPFNIDLNVKKYDVPKAFQADLAIKKPNLPQTFTGDAVISSSGTKDKAFEVDLTLWGTFLKSLPVTAYLILGTALDQTISFTADAELKYIFVTTFNAETTLIISRTKQMTADVTVALTKTKTLAIDLILQKTWNVALLAADALLKSTNVIQQFSADVTLALSTFQAPFTADVQLLRVGIAKTFNADVLISNVGGLVITGSGTVAPALTGSGSVVVCLSGSGEVKPKV